MLEHTNCAILSHCHTLKSANSELELKSPAGKSLFPEHFTQFALLLAQPLPPRRGEEQACVFVCVCTTKLSSKRKHASQLSQFWEKQTENQKV